MKKLTMKMINRLAIGILAFTLGMFAYRVSILNDGISYIDEVNVDLLPVNACSLFSRSDHLLNKSIVVDAVLFQGHEGIMVYSQAGLDCGKSDPEHAYVSSDFDHFGFTILDLNGYKGPNAEIGQLLATTRRSSEIEVQIEGTLIRSATKDNPHRNKLIPTKIKLTSTWRPWIPKSSAKRSFH